ncbi:MEROPS serine peptidase family S33 [Rhizoctonia solani]|uniref:MEROPS serine peptidase family S33 n=1 Tax=Rhizoctonia solani TaxID=456999 RepID=A0A8H7LMZ2_9AGAM|nr:MEROPS serine peptidase family S33 [Rhizoctonia solani]
MTPRNSLKFITIVTLASLARFSSAISIRNTQRISWTPCGNATLPRECGRFEVPLDYADNAAGTGSLAVARLNATVSPRLGTIFINPGGPGESGVDWVLSDDMFLILNGTGGQYDIVSWDPRGVGSTVPRVDCFESRAEEKKFWNGSIRGSDSLEVRTDLRNTTARDEFYSHLDEVDEILIKFGKQCNSQSKDMLKYVGTAATVRDMVALHDYLEGTRLINYWGVSYGTILGSYFVNMFPERVGRIIIDGVVNPWDWAVHQPLQIVYGSINSSDANFNAFASHCAAAGPSKCAISQQNSTTESIRNWVFDLISVSDHIIDRTLELYLRAVQLAYDHTVATGGTVITSGQLRAFLWGSLYHPRQWPDLAQSLAQISAALSNPTSSSGTHQVRDFSRQVHPVPLVGRDNNASTSDPAKVYAYQAITCADAVDAGNSTTKQGFDAIVDITNNYTRMFGPFIWFSGEMYCHHWPVRAVERFTGPFNHTLQNKIMVIGNLYDPITPFASAKAVAEGLGDSAVLLKHNGYGHTSLFMHSSCTVAATSNYFTAGELPPAGTVCETDEKLFP